MAKEDDNSLESEKSRWRSPWLWGSLVLCLATLLHIHYWYLPRERSLGFETAELPTRILAQQDFPLWLWVPYPHQNLGVLGAGTSDLRSLAGAAAKVARISDLKYPRFGPFAVPPSKEILLAADPEAGVFLATARVYPALAVIARLAGRVAGNPWLAGGLVELPQGMVTVSWQGSLWVAAVGTSQGGTGFPGGPVSPGLPGGDQPRLAAGAIDDRLATIPAGVYELFRDSSATNNDLVLRNSGVAGVAVDGEVPSILPSSLLGDATALVGLTRFPETVAQGLVLFDHQGTGRRGGFAVVNAGPARRMPLAGLGVAALLGEDSYSGEASGWYVLASGQENFDTAAFLVPAIDKFLGTWPGSSTGLSARARPAGVLRSLKKVEEALESLLPLTQGELDRLQALQILLEPTKRFPEATLVISQQPILVDLRLTSP